jgi:acetyl-CoA decarbonylase/synthase complex subunit delta
LTTALPLLLAGVDLFMMMHPAAVKTLKNIIDQLLRKDSPKGASELTRWVSMQI